MFHRYFQFGEFQRNGSTPQSVPTVQCHVCKEKKGHSMRENQSARGREFNLKHGE